MIHVTKIWSPIANIQLPLRSCIAIISPQYIICIHRHKAALISALKSETSRHVRSWCVAASARAKLVLQNPRIPASGTTSKLLFATPEWGVLLPRVSYEREPARQLGRIQTHAHTCCRAERATSCCTFELYIDLQLYPDKGFPEVAKRDTTVLQ